ncbi:UNVERIFIED_CONTAM: hypothetical protein Sradi_3251900 [Sesamum radiatum]|uniref:Uncharacterized protein n=1 Tax=Sesamum radiatum TaxID=300843 RepID=A0AAW2QZN0_SESRA
MKLSVGSHPGPDIYVYNLRPCYAELLDIGTSYPIRTTTIATGYGSSSWNSPSSLHTPTALDKPYDDHIRDTFTSRTNPRYSHRVHVTAMIPQVRGLLPYYRSWGLEPYRPSLQGFHMTIPMSKFSQLDT